MDMRKYSGSAFLKTDDVRGGSRKERIAGVTEGRYGKPDVVFESGRKLSINATNNKTLVAAYGAESDNWEGHVIDLYLGQVKYNGEDKDMVLVKAISKPEHYGEASQAEPVRQKPVEPTPKSLADDMDDTIPF